MKIQIYSIAYIYNPSIKQFKMRKLFVDLLGKCGVVN